MSESLPVTTPPQRRTDHPCFPHGFTLPSSESCKNTPNISRKHEHLQHNLMFKSGSHSAHNSPLPHRRLDKLEGVIRDKPSPLSSRRRLTSDDSSSVEPSPSFPRRNAPGNCSCSHNLQTTTTSSNNSSNSSSSIRNATTSEQAVLQGNNTATSYRRNTECSCILKSPENCTSVTDSPRRRVESDCSCMRRSLVATTGITTKAAGKVAAAAATAGSKTSHRSDCLCAAEVTTITAAAVATTSKLKRKDLLSSPAKSVIGEPGVFNSPIHSRIELNSFAGFGSPAKSILGEPGVFASPARSLCASPSPSDEKRIIADEDLAEQPQPDQTVVSGWLKFRDNKRWKIRWGVVTKLSPAADCLHLQLYRDSKDRYKQGQTKASLSLEHFLGVETGFTLDKESNTIAILCQDVIVVLAFDTRERLMQWQVKISNHLGDDIQYLVLVSSTPPKSKMQNGPSRMHIQDHRFCLTTGVPPKLAGLWDIGYLRRYGVVDNRFCFEGGSRCGKGEGLYIFVTDQGDEITQTLKLASQGRLSTKKRQMARKLATTESPRKILSPRPLDTDDSFSCHIDDSTCTCGSRTPYWPSQESRDMDYGCGDTTSVSECHDSFNDGEVFQKNSKANLERCMSCISKLGAPTMSRSSTATGNATPGGNQPPLWTILTEQNNQNSLTVKTISGGGGGGGNGNGIDRMSICSSHGSSGGYGSSGGSEYSVPRMTSTLTTSAYTESCYESIPAIQNCSSISSNHISYQNCPQRVSSSLKCNNSSTTSTIKPPMPLPIVNPLYSHHHNHQHHHHNHPHPHPNNQNCITTQPIHVGPYENYDVPKASLSLDTSSVGAENYDTPKNIQEYLSEDMNSNQTEGPDRYGNYDKPAQIGKMCGCLVVAGQHDNSMSSSSGTITTTIKEGPRNDCTCNRVMSWADNWITIPYCRRGNGIENTGLPINRVKLSGEGKMPVMQPSGELAIYATVDFSKKTNRRTSEKACDCSKDNDNDSETSSSNYINLDPGHVLPENICSEQKDSMTTEPKTDNNCSANYTNLNFAQSLENYENSKEILQKAGITLQELEELRFRENQSFCKKCGHASAKTPESIQDKCLTDQLEQRKEYLTLDTDKNEVTIKFPGYLPMSPAPPNSNGQAPPIPSKSELLKRIIGEKSASNPSLSGPTVDRSRKRPDQQRIPGSAMMLLHRTGSSPYNRKQIMDSSDLLPIEKRLATRKRSSSADSSRFLEDAEEFDSSETLRKSSLTQINDGRRSSSPCLHQEMEVCVDQVCFNGKNTTTTATTTTTTTETEDETSVTSTSQSQNSQSQSSVHIRRSASVPCKAQNRDSSSSNDSGVSTGSLRHRVGDFHEFELPLTTAMSARRHQKHIQPISACVHATLPRRSKSFDPLREISFQFQKIEIPGKSTSAEAEVPVCPAKGSRGGFGSPCEGVSTTGGPPYVDSRSTSSGTSDMSDYIETLSLSSHSSSDAPENLRLLRQATATLRPRSGKEYQNIDRSLIALTQAGDTVKLHNNPPSQLRGLLTCSSNYANITPVPENAESPSPGYQSGGSPQESQAESFVFKNEVQSNQ